MSCKSKSKPAPQTRPLTQRELAIQEMRQVELCLKRLMISARDYERSDDAWGEGATRLMARLILDAVRDLHDAAMTDDTVCVDQKMEREGNDVRAFGHTSHTTVWER